MQKKEAHGLPQSVAEPAKCPQNFSAVVFIFVSNLDVIKTGIR
jgi:hypothetical protein